MAVYDASEEKTNGTRLTRLLVDGGTYVLKELLHSIYPRDKLKEVLEENRSKLESLKKCHVIKDSQWKKLFPPSGDPPDSDTFDITLLHLLIVEFCDLTGPSNGWHKMPAEDDDSVEANIARIKCFRNELRHSASTAVPNDEFEEKWKQVSSCLEAFELYAYRQKIERLKSDPIDHDIERRVKEQVGEWERLDNELLLFETEQQSIKVPSCLPDELTEDFMFGRSQEIQQVTEAIQSGSVSFVWITGGPGFGKTTVASKAAHELTRLERKRAVLFCSLRYTKSLSDTATLMALVCSRNQKQPPENPKLWLLNWSKQQISKVTFVLDNADEVLQDSDGVDAFLDLLKNMRRFSRQNVTFIITSRTACNPPSPQSKNVRLACLPVEEAKKILLSRVPDLEFENRPKLSNVDKLVKLCGFVPLALCIAGSLLSDYNEDELIKSLEEEPSDVLQVGRRSTDQTSVEKSIKKSFEILNEVEQKALVLLSVFPGSFNSDAAKSLIAGSTTISKSVSILRELKDRSLVEQLGQCRYQVHQLIQAFVQKIALEKYPDLLDQGKKLACAYFISRLADNANLYWGKDTCKQSMDSFNEDRHNYEYFLQVYTDIRREIEDQERVKFCKTFLDDFPQKCMYLEMCILPRFYISILERLLETFDSETQPLHRVELLCLLGHEFRKVGDTRKYNASMEEAGKLYEENGTDFERNPLSEVIYLQSYARFLSENKVRNELKNVFQKALRICEEKLPEHPERAAVLLFAGRNDKYHDEMEAVQKIEQALQLFGKCLGEHFMTAQCLKNLADLILFPRSKTDDPEKALYYYKEALEMMEKLEMDGRKESIQTLKNYGICHKKIGNFEEARDLLTKAERVAERELDEDHMWKVMVKTEQALLYDEEGKTEQMEEAMKKGLQMLYRLGQTVEKLGSKHKIRETLNRHPELFPKEEYPR